MATKKIEEAQVEEKTSIGLIIFAIGSLGFLFFIIIFNLFGGSSSSLSKSDRNRIIMEDMETGNVFKFVAGVGKLISVDCDEIATDDNGRYFYTCEYEYNPKTNSGYAYTDLVKTSKINVVLVTVEGTREYFNPVYTDSYYTNNGFQQAYCWGKDNSLGMKCGY